MNEVLLSPSQGTKAFLSTLNSPSLSLSFPGSAPKSSPTCGTFRIPFRIFLCRSVVGKTLKRTDGSRKKIISSENKYYINVFKLKAQKI